MEAELIKQIVLQMPALAIVTLFGLRVLDIVRQMAKDQHEATAEALAKSTAALNNVEALLREMYGYMRRLSGNGSKE